MAQRLHSGKCDVYWLRHHACADCDLHPILHQFDIGFKFGDVENGWDSGRTARANFWHESKRDVVFVGVSAVPDVADHFDRDRRSTLARRTRGVVQRQCVSGDDGGVDRANSSGVFSLALFAGLRADDRDFGWGRVGGDHDPVAARLGDRRHRSDDRSGRDVRLAGVDRSDSIAA